MNKIKVYQWQKWDQSTGREQTAPRMATRAFIRMARGEPVEKTEMEIDASLLDANGQADISVQPTGLA